MSVVQETTGTGSFAHLLDVEHQTIQARRTQHKRSPVDADAPPDPDRSEVTGFVVYNTSGLALSGGGVRSAAFCLGALQALNEAPGLGKIDYLSTVSGGGYMGAALTATMAKTGAFVFASPNDYSDQRAVGHLRNYSNYLLPRGESGSFVRGIAVVLRGLIVNLALVLVFALGFAVTTVWAYPTRSALTQGSFLISLFHLRSWPMALTVAIVAAQFCFMLGWAIWRSCRIASGCDIRGMAVTVASGLLIALVFVAFLDIQPLLIAGLFELHRPSGTFAASIGGLKNIVAALTPFAGIAAVFANKLSHFLNSTRRAKGAAMLSARLGAKALFFFAAVILSLMVWLLVLYISAAGIRDDSSGYYPFSGGFFDYVQNLNLFGYRPKVLSTYLAAFAVMLFITLWFKPNANSLHRLYRDRLSKAFLFYPRPEPPDASDESAIVVLDDFKLIDMSPPNGGPYHLINAALNIEASKVANRRGRNADFFLFSANFVGSDSTGYVRAKDMQDADSLLDLGTAMAISGAAVSSDMGSKSVRVLAPTLALLNLRLGYWMRNPRFIGEKPRWSDRLHDFTKFYLALEMFGRLDECKRHIYLTDGGHIEDLGIYQLLKRGCRTIIAIDAEEDQTLEFSSLVTLQRYARIDLGIRIELPWEEIAATSRAVTALAAGDEPIPSRSGPHCALGIIHYPNGIDGYLLYMKSSLSGDENDYILDYKRRNPSFPYESTSDQFFTEEQFEVYRSLGFHVASGFFAGDQEFSWVARDQVKSPHDMVREFVNAL
jgi:hypothetical protein